MDFQYFKFRKKIKIIILNFNQSLFFKVQLGTYLVKTINLNKNLLTDFRLPFKENQINLTILTYGLFCKKQCSFTRYNIKKKYCLKLNKSIK